MGRIISKEVGCIKQKGGENFDIYVTTRYIDSFGKYYNENKLWDSCPVSKVDHEVAMAKKWNGLEYSCRCEMCKQ